MGIRNIIRQLTVVIIFLIVVYIVIWYWVKSIDPDPSVSIALIFLVPFIIVLNLVIAAILYFLKKRKLIVYFIINAAVTPFILSNLFSKGVERNLNDKYEEWSFNISDTTFKILRERKLNSFNMSYSNIVGISTGFLDGECKAIKNGYLLTTD